MQVASNGVDFSFDNAWFTYYPAPKVMLIWPTIGPASEGGTVITVHGEGFYNTSELSCKFGTFLATQAIWLSLKKVLCLSPSHGPGVVPVYVTNNGIDFSGKAAEFLYTNDASVEDIQPTKVLETGQVPIFVKGYNFLNTTSLCCRFGTTVVKGTFLSPKLLVCTAPSHTTQPRLQRINGFFSLEVSINGLDFTRSGKAIEYTPTNPDGYYKHNGLSIPSPNGTYSAVDGLNFTSCQPETFQPSAGTSQCLLCPVGYICPGEISHFRIKLNLGFGTAHASLWTLPTRMSNVH